MRFWVRNFACAPSLRSPIRAVRVTGGAGSDLPRPGCRQRFKWGASHFSDKRRTRNRAPRFFYACRSAAARGRRDRGAIPERCIGSE
jgi:hypothetical protein